LPVGSLAVVPPLVYPGNPNFAKIRTAVAARIAEAEAADAPAATPAPSATPARPKKKVANAGKAGTNTDDLSAVCAA
jgi:hypothetical protein